MKLIAILSLIAATATAQPWIHEPTGSLVFQRPARINWPDGAVTFNPTPADYDRAGYVLAVTVTNVSVSTNEIPPAIQAVAAAYKAAMEDIFGEGAHTNTAITEGMVAITLSLDPETDINVALRLKTWSDILAATFGTTYDPAIYGLEIVTTNATTTYEAAP